jgi:hypothetical protein
MDSLLIEREITLSSLVAAPLKSPLGGLFFSDPSLLILLYNYSTCRTNRVLTRLVRRVRVYAFGVLTTRLRV